MADFVLKPGPVARRADYLVEVCAHAEAAGLIRAIHYTGGASNTAVAAHCLRRKLGGQLVGAALWMPPTKVAAQAAARVVLGDAERWQEVLTLSRLVVVEGEPFNTAGLLLAASTRAVAKLAFPGPRFVPRFVVGVTYADTAQQHTGIIYRATGWTYAGLTAPEPIWKDVEGKQVSRKATRTRTNAEMRKLGYHVDGSSQKHRFYKKLSGTPWPVTP